MRIIFTDHLEVHQCKRSKKRSFMEEDEPSKDTLSLRERNILYLTKLKYHLISVNEVSIQFNCHDFYFSH